MVIDILQWEQESIRYFKAGNALSDDDEHESGYDEAHTT